MEEFPIGPSETYKKYIRLPKQYKDLKIFTIKEHQFKDHFKITKNGCIFEIERID